MHAFVPRPPRLETLLDHLVQRGCERVDERRGDRVVIFPPQPVILEQREIESRSFGTPRGARARADANITGDESRRRAKPFL